MTYRIVSDSSANLLTLKDVDFKSVPLKIRVEGKEYIDDENVDVKEMVEHLKRIKTKSTTACPSPEEYFEAFGDAERIFCTTISGGLSGSYNAARIAKEDYESKYPGKKVFVIDSVSAGPGVAMIAEKLEELIVSGKDYDEICDDITEYRKTLYIYFSLESLKNFANNGRVSPAVAKITGILGIRLVGTASEEGTLMPVNKCRGEKKALEAVYNNMMNSGYNGGRVRISHCENENAAEVLRCRITAEFPGADIEIMKNRALCSFYAETGGFLVSFEGKAR